MVGLQDGSIPIQNPYVDDEVRKVARDASVFRKRAGLRVNRPPLGESSRAAGGSVP